MAMSMSMAVAVMEEGRFVSVVKDGALVVMPAAHVWMKEQ